MAYGTGCLAHQLVGSGHGAGLVNDGRTIVYVRAAREEEKEKEEEEEE